MAEALIEQHNSETYLSVDDYVKAYQNGDLQSLTYLNTGILSNVRSGLFGTSSWYMRNLKKLDMPNVKTIQGRLIGQDHYDGINIEEINADKLEFIGEQTFYGCYSLTTLSLPNVSYIESASDGYTIYNAFYGCTNLKEIYLNKCEWIGKYAFVASRSWDGCRNLETVYLPECKKIDSWAFYGCSKLSSITIPKVSSLGYEVFRDCSSLKELYLLGYSYIDNESLINYPFGSIVESQKSLYFNNVSYISGISNSYPQSVRMVLACDAYFPKCKIISNAYILVDALYLENCETISKTILSFVSSGIGYLYVPKLSIFTSDTTNFEYLREVFAPACRFIESHAFKGCSYLSKITLSRCETVKEYAFNGCSSLSILKLPNCTSFTFLGNGLNGFYKTPLINTYILPKLSELILWSSEYTLEIAVTNQYLNMVNRIEFGGNKLIANLLSSYDTGALGINELICDKCEEIEINSEHFNTNQKLVDNETWINYEIDGLHNYNGNGIWHDGNDIYYSYEYNHYKLDKNNNKWIKISWHGIELIAFYGYYIWTDGTDIYYSSSSNQYKANQQYKLNRSTNTWEPMTWSGLTDFDGYNIWTDGTDIYYSSTNSQSGEYHHYKLIIETSTWETMTWYGFTDFDGSCIWTDETDIYYTRGLKQYKLDISTHTWNKYTQLSKAENFDGSKIWNNGDKIYYSYKPTGDTNKQFILDKNTRIWSEETWNGYDELDGVNVWTDGVNIYYSYYGNQYNHNDQFILDEVTNTWIETTFIGPACTLDGSCIWTDGTDIYQSIRHDQYILDRNTNEWSKINWIGLPENASGSRMWSDGIDTYYSSGTNQYVLNKSINTWEPMTWSGLTDLYGNYVWTDGTDIYYSDSSTQYKLDISTHTWSKMNWSGLTDFYGQYIWKSGSDVYYSSSSIQYKLDSSTHKWSKMTWSGLTSFNGNYVWTDGYNIYYSSSSTQYKLDFSTNTWSRMTWSGLTDFNGNYVWTDGTNVYYSAYDSRSNYLQYKLDISTHTWSIFDWYGPTYQMRGVGVWHEGLNVYYSYGDKQYKFNIENRKWSKINWSGLTNFYGSYIWTDGIDTYYSSGTNQYVLNKSINTWEPMTWSGLTNFNGEYIWKEGNNIYYSINSSQYKLNKSTHTWSKMTWHGLTDFDGNYVWTDGSNIYYSYYYGDTPQYKLNISTNTWVEIDFYSPYYFYGQNIWTDGTNIYYSGGRTTEEQYKLNKSTHIWYKMIWSGLRNSNYFYGQDIWTDGNNIYYTVTESEKRQTLEIWNTGYIEIPKLKKITGNGALYFNGWIDNAMDIGGNLHSSYIYNFNISFPKLEEGYVWIHGPGQWSTSETFPANFNISLPKFSKGTLLIGNYYPFYNYSNYQTVLPSYMSTLYLQDVQLSSLNLISVSTFITHTYNSRYFVAIYDMTFGASAITEYCDLRITGDYNPRGSLPDFNSSGYNIDRNTIFSVLNLPNCSIINTNTFNNRISARSNINCPMLETLNVLYVSRGNFSYCYISANNVYMPKLSNISIDPSTSMIISGSNITLGFSRLPASTNFKIYANRYLSLSNLQSGLDYSITVSWTTSSIYLPKCTYIGSSVFSQHESISTISLPECLSIYDYAFYSCSKLKYFSAPKLKYIGSRALYGTSLTLLELLNVEEIGDYGLPSCINLVKFGNRVVSMHSGITIKSAFLIQVPTAYYSRYLSAEPYATWLSQISSKFGIIQY